jgi:hypothetical protein
MKYGWQKALTSLTKVVGGNRTASFNIKPDVKLIGAFKGNETNNIPLGDPNNCTLSGKISDDQTFWSLTILTFDVKGTSSLSGFNIVGSNHNAGDSTAYGGAILSKTANTISFHRCIFEDHINRFLLNYNGWSKFHFDQCVFYDPIRPDDRANHGRNNVSFDARFSRFNNCLFINFDVLCDGSFFRQCTFGEWARLEAYKFNGVVRQNSESRSINCILFAGDSSLNLSLHHEVMIRSINKIDYPGDPSYWDPIFYSATINWNGAVGENSIAELEHNYDRDVFEAFDRQVFVRNVHYDLLFLDTENPKGNDGKWFTSDDGYNLKSDSPAIDFGVTGLIFDSEDDFNAYEAGTKEIPLRDITNRSRLVGSAIDVGAYEFGATTVAENSSDATQASSTLTPNSTLSIDGHWGWLKLPWIYHNGLKDWVYFNTSGTTSFIYSNKYKVWYRWDGTTETWVLSN